MTNKNGFWLSMCVCFCSCCYFNSLVYASRVINLKPHTWNAWWKHHIHNFENSSNNICPENKHAQNFKIIRYILFCVLAYKRPLSLTKHLTTFKNKIHLTLEVIFIFRTNKKKKKEGRKKRKEKRNPLGDHFFTFKLEIAPAVTAGLIAILLI